MRTYEEAKARFESLDSERALLAADRYRPRFPQEVDLANADEFRRYSLRVLIGTYRRTCEVLTKYGFLPDYGHDLFREAVARMEIDLPHKECPLCVGKMPKPSCLCKGKGWFSKRQNVALQQALLRANRPYSNESALQAVFKAKGGLRRAPQSSIAANKITRELLEVQKQESEMQNGDGVGVRSIEDQRSR